MFMLSFLFGFRFFFCVLFLSFIMFIGLIILLKITAFINNYFYMLFIDSF